DWAAATCSPLRVGRQPSPAVTTCSRCWRSRWSSVRTRSGGTTVRTRCPSGTPTPCGRSSSSTPSSTRAGEVDRPRVVGQREHGLMAATDTDVFATHEVLNQPPPLSGYDVFSADDALVEAVEREEAGGALDELRALGRQAGDADWQEKGRLANQNPPV